MAKNPVHHLKHVAKSETFTQTRFSKTNIIVFALIFAAIGGYLIFRTFAAGPLASIEPEDGTITAPAFVVNDASASGGKAVQFGTAATGSCPVSTPNLPDGPDAFGGCFPGPQTTGVPAGTVLSAYTGSCTISTANTVIDSKIVNCGQLTIAAANVQIKNSRINGYPFIENYPNSFSVTITDSELINPSAADNSESLGKSNFTVIRSEMSGGRRGAWCEYNCTVQDSYIHGQEHGVLNCTTAGCAWHESGIRMGSGTSQVIRHNTVVCDAPDVAAKDPNAPGDTSGCSADLTGYGDFALIQYNTIDKNLFLATPGGTCTYGGNSAGNKPFPNGDHNSFTSNVFQKRSAIQSSGKCGTWFANADFNASLTGNVWTNNKYDDGTTAPPNQ